MAKPAHIGTEEWAVRCDLAALYRLAPIVSDLERLVHHSKRDG